LVKLTEQANKTSGLPPFRVVLTLAASIIAALFLVACGGQPDATSPSPTASPSPDAYPDNGQDQTPIPGGHAGDEGLVLRPQADESVYAAARCPSSATVREFNAVAINVEITLNSFLDYDPIGRMYVLEEELARVRAEETQNKAARADRADPAVSIGLQDDAIQPLTIRVNQGDCLRLNLRNGLDDGESASFHLHGSGLQLTSDGTPAVAANTASTAAPGQTVGYEWMVAEDQPEGTHYFHSHGNTREQTAHGLFGAVIVEPKGTEFLDPATGDELRSGWAAVIRDPSGSDFREFAIYYHEIGNEAFTIQNKTGAFGFGLVGSRAVPFVDEFTGAYKPGGRAINYRSEPFMNRMQLQLDETGIFDPSLAYSSYTFGDPATPIARTYLGDPVKQRVVHGGSEVFHVHHVHGGATRWRRQPAAEPTAFDSGFDKSPNLLPQTTSRTDSQTLGPSESFDLEHECGSGGCQESVGDFLVHCHVAHHYVAGMWMIWRVQNTLQTDLISLDGLPGLPELPDRTGGVQPAVTSDQLLGTTVDWNGKEFQIDASNLVEWVERQLPPQGVPQKFDASLLNWSKQGDTYLNEPNTSKRWPGYDPPSPGVRPPLYFDPATGKLAYPFLTPHLGRRPPFAPNHGPAPYLEPIRQGTDVPRPGENGPGSLCPSGATTQEFTIHAISLPIALNRQANLVDPVGQLYVLKEEEDDVRANNARKQPLVIRANAGEDCVDVLLKSELPDTGENNFYSKTNLHIHFVQFDIQGSDGVDTGFNYETSVRPFDVEGERLTESVLAGESSVVLGSALRCQSGALVGVGMDQDETFEVRRIASVDGKVVTFDEPMEFNHEATEIVSTEFVRYRWFPDVQFGTAYFHDHVSALSSWRHGLFGALISEPPGSTYHDPQTGEEVRSGPRVDVHTDQVLSDDITGSFREQVLFIQDDNPLTSAGLSSGSTMNLRVEPLDRRRGDPSLLFSSVEHGDPETPLLEANLGDPIVIRGLVSAANDTHTLHVDGHWFRIEPNSQTSPPVSTVHIGISERYDLAIPRAGGPQNMPGDYLYSNGRSFKLREGSWGLLRVHPPDSDSALQPLPGVEPRQPSSQVCPANAPKQTFDVSAIDLALPMLGGGQGKIFALEHQIDGLRRGDIEPQPLVLRANVGDCILVRLTNETVDGPVSFHADNLAYDPLESMGIAAGFNPPQTVAAGETRTYTFYAHPEIGETTAMVRDWGNVLENPRLGLYGAVIVGPTGASYSDPVTGENVSDGWRVDVHPPSGSSYRDFAIFMQDEDEVIGTHLMPYSEAVARVSALNYRLAPLAPRLAANPAASLVFDPAIHGDPATPVLEAYAGDGMRIHVLVPVSEQAQVFSIEGHDWPLEPGLVGTNMLSSVQVGALEAITAVIESGAGGRSSLPGDYLYGDHREPYREAGLWGLLRVYGQSQEDVPLIRLGPPDSTRR